MTLGHLHCDFIERSAARAVTSTGAGIGLPAANDGIDIKRVKFEAVTAPAGTLCRHHGRPTTEKVVEDDIRARGTIHDRVGYQRGRFHRRMHRQQIALIA
jgi:hypothetical protein